MSLNLLKLNEDVRQVKGSPDTVRELFRAAITVTDGKQPAPTFADLARARHQLVSAPGIYIGTISGNTIKIQYSEGTNTTAGMEVKLKDDGSGGTYVITKITGMQEFGAAMLAAAIIVIPLVSFFALLVLLKPQVREVQGLAFEAGLWLAGIPLALIFAKLSASYEQRHLKKLLDSICSDKMLVPQEKLPVVLDVERDSQR